MQPSISVGVTPNSIFQQPTTDYDMSEFNEEYELYADPLDLAVAQQDRLLRAKLTERKPEGPKATGFCLDPYCGEQLVSDEVLEKIRSGEPVPDGTPRWCSAECRNAFEKTMAAYA